MIHMKAFLSFVLVTGFFFCTPVGAKDNSEKKSKDDSYEKEHKKNHKQEHEDEKPWSFKVSKAQGDAPLVVTFDASGIKPAKKYYWNFGNGDKLVTDKSMVTYQYKVAGTYTASLKFAVNASEKELKDLKDGGSIVIKVLKEVPPENSPPVAALSCSVNNLLVACSGITSYDPENQPLIFKFDFADGFTETNTTGFSSHAYAVPGLYNVQLSVFDSAGASGVTTLSVQAVKPPNQLPVLALNCSSDVINTLNCDANGSTDSDGNIVSYSYSWDDNTNESKGDSTSVTHVYSNSGSHSVTLTAVDNDGGVSTLTKSFTVKANTNPIAAFNCDNSKPLKLVCTSTSTDPDAGDAIQYYTWKFGSNSEFISTTGTTDYNFSSGGDVEVTLLVTDLYGGKKSLTKTFSVKENQLPTFDFNADIVSGIAPLKVHFQIFNAMDSDGTITSYNLNFGDDTTSGSNDVVHTFNTPGTYNVVAAVNDDFGGTTTKTKKITVTTLINNPPQAFFKIFEFDTWVELHATLTKTEYEIKRAYYTIDGTDIVELTEFYPNTVNWVDLKELGEHEITLTVEDIYGQKSSFTHTFNQTENLDLMNPYTDFRVQQSAARTVFINFNRAFDFDIDQPIQSFHIDYGNGESEDTTELYKTHIFTAPGIYTITVKSISSHGTESTAKKTISVTDVATAILPPAANFSYRIYDVAQNVSFYNDRSGTPNGSIVSYLWDFGDGTNGSGQKIAHFYNPGSYLVTLTVVDSAGQQSSQTERVTIFGTGTDLITVIDCSLVDPYVEKTQQCQIIALDKLNQISRVRVTWGDGQASVLSLTSTNGIFKPTHKYGTAGNFSVNVTVTTTRGEVKTAATNINLSSFDPTSYPIPNLNCTSVFHTANCSAQGSFDPNNLQLTYAIVWGDGTQNIGAEINYDHTYSSAGTYTVTLTAKNSDGTTNKISKEITISDNNIFPAINCNTSNLLVQCDSLASYDLLGSTLIYTFDYGDGFKETNLTGISSHVYSGSGTYTVKVAVLDGLGLYSEVSTLVMPLKAPNISPIAKLSCKSTVVNQVDCNALGSTDLDGSLISYRYDFSDGTYLYTGTVETISKNFIKGGMQFISLSIMDNEGAITTTSTNINVIETSAFDIIASETSGAVPLNVNFNMHYDASVYGEISSIEWGFGDGTTSNDLSPTHIFSNPGNFNVNLKIKTQDGTIIEKAIKISAISESIIIINAENESNLIPFLVNLDASQSYDEFGQIVLYEWFYQGKKVAEGERATLKIQDKGANVISLAVTNSLGTKTWGKKIIQSADPAIYIEDNFIQNATVGEEYSGKIILSSTSSIPLDNIQVEIENPPAGFEFDAINKSYRWTPITESPETISFKIKATDGIISTEREVNLSIARKEILAVIDIPQNGGTFVINDPTSEYNGMKLNLPANNEAYSVQFVKFSYSDKTTFELQSSSSIIYEYEYANPQPVSYTDFKFDDDSLTAQKDLSFEIAKGRACSVEQAKGSKLISKIQKNLYPSDRDAFKVFATKKMVNFWAKDSISESFITNLINDSDFVTKLPDHIYNLYFEVQANRKSNGVTPLNSLDTSIIYLSPSGWSPFEHIRVKKTVFHEAYHVRQFEITKCNLPPMPKYTSEFALDEGSADYNAIKKLRYNERIPILQNLYSLQMNNPFSINYYTSFNGVLWHDDTQKTGYQTRLIWDYFGESDDYYKYIYNLHGSNLFYTFGYTGQNDFSNYAKGLIGENIHSRIKNMLFNYYDLSDIDVMARYENTPLYYTLKTTDFTLEWINSYEELYKRQIGLGLIKYYSLDEKKKDVYDGNYEVGPMSGERAIVNVPSVLNGFNTEYFPFYLITNSADQGWLPEFYNSKVMLYKNLSTDTVVYKFGSKTFSNSSPILFSDFQKFSFDGLLRKDSFEIDVINSQNDSVKPVIKVRPACIVKENVSAYAGNALPQLTVGDAYGFSRLNGLDILTIEQDTDHNIQVKCGKKCRIVAKLCSSSFDQSKTDAWDESSASKDCFIQYRIANNNNELKRIEIPESGAVISPALTTEPSYNPFYAQIYKSWFYTPSSLWPGAYTTKLYTGKLIVCQVAGDYDPDKSPEQNIILE